MAKYYFRFRVDFPRNARKQPCLHALPTSQYERGRRQSCLHCEPDLRFTVIQLHLRDNSCLALHPVFVLFDRETVTSLRFTHSHDFDARVNFFRLNQNSTRGKKSAGRRKGTQSRACHTFILIARSWTGLSEPCPGRRQWKAKGAPGAPRRRRAAAERAGGRGKVWPLPPLRPPDWFIPADRPWATAESFMTSPSRWAESSSLTPRLRDAAKSSNQLEGDHRCERLKLPINRPFKTKKNLCFFFFVSPRLKLNLCCVQDLPVKQEQRGKAGWLALTSTSKDIPVFFKMYLFFKSWWVRFDSLLDRCVWKPFFSQKETYVNLYNEVGMINITLT